MKPHIRITGGNCRGRGIESLAGDRTRPTSSIVRQALFNILGSPRDLNILDLYAGTGAVGLEALSRGAGKVVWVESHRPTANLIERNRKALSFSEGCVFCQSVQDYISNTSERFDWVFIDPPFVENYPVELDFSVLLRPGGVLIYQFPTHQQILWRSPLHKTYKYGESSLGILYCDP